MSGRYFVTGAQGFVGRFFVARLLENDRDSEVLGIGRSPADDTHFTHTVHWGSQAVRAPLPPELTSANAVRYRYEAADLRDREYLSTLLKSFRPNYIVHLASGLRDDPLEHLFRTNVEGTVNLIEALIAAKVVVQRFVFGSSGAIYGRSALTKLPLDEESPCLPADLYSASKLASEHVSRILTEENGIPAVWARIFNIVGPGQDERHFCGKVASQLAAMQAGVLPPTIEVGDLRPTRDFIDVRDVAGALATLAVSGRSGHAYNVASGNETSMERVLTVAVNISGLTGKVTIDNKYRRPADIPQAYADTAKLRDLGFINGFDLHRSLSDLIGYYRTTVREAAG